MATAPTIGHLAETLADAWDHAEAVPAPSRLRPGTTLEEAYTIQEMIIERRLGDGRDRAGWKLGLTSSPGVTPIVGTILDDMVIDSGAVLDPVALVTPLVEAELAFIVGEPIEAGADVADLAGGGHRVAAALEVIDYRTVDADGVVDWVADNSTVAYAVLGSPLPLAETGPLAGIEVTLGRDGQTLATGTGAKVMGDPAAAVVWLAGFLGERGRRLEAGSVILTGSLTGHHPVIPGSSYTAVFSGLGKVTVRFGPEESP